MNLTSLIVFVVISLLVGLATAWSNARFRPVALGARNAVMLVGSVLAVYWLQSSTPVRGLDFWLPTASLGLTVIVWVAVTGLPRAGNRRDTGITLAVIAAVIVAIALTRYVDPLCCLTPSRPPDILAVLIGLALIAALAAGAGFLFGNRPAWLNWAILLILAVFVVLKTDALSQAASALLRSLTGQDTAQASALDLRWLGFSYIAFRLMHVLRDRATGRFAVSGPLATKPLALSEFFVYVVFFPALTAGPIDRVERFVKDMRAGNATGTSPLLRSADIIEGGRRILLGVFKKFVVADLLALVALNGVSAAQVNSALWMWLLVYAYALRIYFDFGGYTDIAIGLGRCFGIRLPENFDQPYLKPNLTVFWNSWHITLAQWFRAYFFNPVTRALRSPKETPWLPAARFFRSPAFIILFGQVGTMLLIGLWHGITWNFVAWGAWHAFGLFAHNRWADFMRRRNAAGDPERAQVSPALRRIMTAASVLLTFHYVALGWVWFALPSLDLSLNVFRKLFGAM
ncbi:MAG: hypothetical protein M1434_00615 [Chloroflexi bacterium]|nr:hypothetical protein [Chloroflexota bacterium]MCL5273235.1 hypothetical protein [Chloroflexota bacterium]